MEEFVVTVDEGVRQLVQRELDYAMLVVFRSDIEDGDIGSTLESLEKLKTAIRNIELHGKADLAIQGYDEDTRELFEVPEVCDHLRLLTREFPYFFYFANLETPALTAIAACVCGAEKLAEGRISISNQDLLPFLEQQFSGLNELTEEFDLDQRFPGFNRRIRERIMKYFDL